MIFPLLMWLAGMSVAFPSGSPDRFANVSFIVWKRGSGSEDTVLRMNTSVPEVLRDSWRWDLPGIDLDETIRDMKTLEKEDFRFVLRMEAGPVLRVEVFEKGRGIFGLILPIHTDHSKMEADLDLHEYLL